MRLALLLPVLMSVATTAGAQASRSTFMYPPMVQRPTPTQIQAAAPSGASQLAKPGWVQLQCVFSADGELFDCAAIQTSNPGLGLEAAAVDLADRFRLDPAFAERHPGSSVVVKIRFGPPWAEDPTAPPILSPPAPPAPSHNPVIMRPDWVRKPSGDAVKRAYPKAALAAGLGGRVTLSCLVNADGTVRDCKVVSENPGDMGFGEAAIRLSGLFRMRETTADGKSVGGNTVRIPVSFWAPEPLPKPEPKPKR